MPSGVRVDWNAARRRYVTSSHITMQELARELGVNERTIFRHASVESWVAKKQEHASHVSEKATEKIVEKQASASASLAETIGLEAESIRKMAISALREFVRTEVKPDGSTVSRTDIREDASKFRALVQAWAEANRVSMLLAGLPTERSQVEQTATGLEDVPRDQLREWYEDIYRKARGDGKGLSRTAHPEDAVE